MWRENPPWGQKIIGAESAKLGYNVAPRTVAKYRPSSLDRQRGQRWATFIRNHLSETRRFFAGVLTIERSSAKSAAIQAKAVFARSGSDSSANAAMRHRSNRRHRGRLTWRRTTMSC